MTRQPPIFLFGFERSGTTLLSMMAGAHPELAVPLSTTGTWYRLGRRIEADYNALATPADVERLVDDLLAEERIKLWDETFTRDEILDGLPTGNFGAVIDRFHGLYARRKDKACWGNIDIATIYDMDMAHRWFPDARFVHIVRDGRDVALSHLTYRYGLSNIGETADVWREVVETNMKMGAMLPPDQYMVLRYEDLILDSEATLARLCDFMGLPYAPEMLDYARAVDEKIPDSKRFLWPAIGKPPQASKAYGWKQKMSADRRVVFEWKAGGLLKALGYETYDHVPKRPFAYLLEIWYFLGRGHRFRRIARLFARTNGRKR